MFGLSLSSRYAGATITFVGASAISIGLLGGTAPALAGPLDNINIPTIADECLSNHSQLGSAWATFNNAVDGEKSIFTQQVNAKTKTYVKKIRLAKKNRNSMFRSAKKMAAQKRADAIANANEIFGRVSERVEDKTETRLAKISLRKKPCASFEMSRDKTIEAANVVYSKSVGDQDGGAANNHRLQVEKAENAQTARYIPINETYGYCMVGASEEKAVACVTERDTSALESKREFDSDNRVADEILAGAILAAEKERAKVTGI